MRTLKFLTLLIIAGTISFTSCKKDEETPVEEATNSTLKKGEISLRLTELYKNDWVYFSFASGSEVSDVDSTNYQSKTNWDIAFHSRLGRTNSGTSTTVGSNGGIYDANSTDFDIVNIALENSVIVDDSVNFISAIGNYGPEYIKMTGNTVFDNAFDVDYTQHPPIYTPTNEVYIVQTADGKYAKMQITSYFNDEGESGHITFKYAYQSDGSTKLN